ncbi:josephin-2 [Aphelenchoides avenae]|nr:josephin-2 [Aphelenchus avenae]
MHDASELKKLYHEKQSRQMCLLHTLNNLFQREEFNKAELDEICENLDPSRWLNAHRSMLGLGNYDVNILMSALETRDLCVGWFDNRMNANVINTDAVFAYVFNIPSTGWVPFVKGRHWFAVIRAGHAFYNMDSKLPEPVPIDDLVLFANKQLAEGNQLFLVTKREDFDRRIRNTDTP